MNSLQPSYYEMLAAEGVRDRGRIDADHLLSTSQGRRTSLWRRSIALVGQGFVYIGRKLERVEQSEQTMIYGS